jgi:hypothetical protein
MPRGHIVRQPGGRRHVLFAINAETARPRWPDVRLRRSAYVMSHKPRGSGGSLSKWGAWCKPRTRASTEPLLGRGPGIPCPRILGPGGDLSGPHTEVSGIFLGGPPVTHGVRCFPRGRPGPTACIRSTLFPLAAWRLMLHDGEPLAAQLEALPSTRCLYLVTRGTHVSRYRQWPPGLPRGRA